MNSNKEISSRAGLFPSSPIRKLNPLADKAKNEGVVVHHVNIGQPDIPTPTEFMKGIRETEIEVLSYSPSRGKQGALRKLQGYYEDHDINLNLEDLMITVGGSEAGIFAFYIALEPGDEILIPEPFYTNYRGFAKMTGVKITPIPTTKENNFALPEGNKIEKLVSKDTSAILLTNPSNPTGRVFSEKEMKLVKQIVQDNDLFLISDEVYREFVYTDKEAISALNLKGIEDQTIMIDSISKRLSGCGARIGTLASKNEKIMQSALKLGQSRLSPPTMGQIGLAAFLDSPKYPKAIKDMVKTYGERRNVLLEELSKINGVDFGKPEGAFYIMLSLPVENAEKFVKWMLRDFRQDGETVMMAPGQGFYDSSEKGKSEVRLSYVLKKNTLSRVANLIKKGLKEYEAAGYP